MTKDPLTHREALIILERLYDIIIEAETIKQSQVQALEEDEEVSATRFVYMNCQRSCIDGPLEKSNLMRW